MHILCKLVYRVSLCPGLWNTHGMWIRERLEYLNLPHMNPCLYSILYYCNCWLHSRNHFVEKIWHELSRWKQITHYGVLIRILLVMLNEFERNMHNNQQSDHRMIRWFAMYVHFTFHDCYKVSISVGFAIYEEKKTSISDHMTRAAYNEKIKLSYKLNV